MVITREGVLTSVLEGVLEGVPDGGSTGGSTGGSIEGSTGGRTRAESLRALPACLVMAQARTQDCNTKDKTAGADAEPSKARVLGAALACAAGMAGATRATAAAASME